MINPYVQFGIGAKLIKLINANVLNKLQRIRCWALNMQYLKGIDFSEKNNKCFGTPVLQPKTLLRIGA